MDSKACVRIRNEVSEWFSVNFGVRRGCVMSPWLLMCFVVGDGEQKGEVSQLRLADDTVLVADSKKKLERLVEEFDKVCRRRNLKVVVAKSKVMRSARDGIVGEMNIMMDGLVLDEVNVFKKLGSLVTAVGEVEADVEQRVLDGVKYWEW